MKLLITGGGSGIGEAIARRRALAGDEVWVTASSDASAAQLTQRYAAAGISARIERFELRGGACSPALEAELSRFDSLVLNAAPKVEALRRFHQFDEVDLREAFELDVVGNLSLLRRVLPGMCGRRLGRIVLVSSAVVPAGGARYPLYCLTKGALESLATNLAVDYGSFGVLTNVVRPGIIRTERTRRFWEKEGYEARVARAVPAGRIGEPTEVARAIDPMLERECYMNGSVVNVSGGLPLTRVGAGSS